MSGNDRVPTPTRHDPATGNGSAFVVGAVDVGQMKGSQGAPKREVRDVALGSNEGQPALKGQYAHPIPPTKGDRR